MTGDATRLAVTGAGGHMGGEVIAAAAARDDVDVVLAVDRPSVEGPAGVDVADEADLPALLADRDPDVLVDFTVPDATRRYVAACADAGVAAVVGTTGLTDDVRERVRAASDRVPVLVASNFSRGVAALRRAVREAVGTLPGYDVEITDTHHNRKRDAPSGTARTLLDDVDEVRGTDAERVHGREGEQPREEGEIGVHARRAGDVTGSHEVLLADNHEVLQLRHRAESRGVFAAGALDAAAWIDGRAPGRYEFTEVLE
ncbi:MAG: 4-hydroxy-tetrahydrodipicolinate reductase [Haloferacaceae archaeon]